MDFKAKHLAILEKYQQMSQKVEELTMKYENVNLEIEIQKIQKENALRRCEEYENYVKNLETHIKESYEIEDKLKEEISELKKKLIEKENAEQKISANNELAVASMDEINLEKNISDPPQFLDLSIIENIYSTTMGKLGYESDDSETTLEIENSKLSKSKTPQIINVENFKLITTSDNKEWISLEYLGPGNPNFFRKMFYDKIYERFFCSQCNERGKHVIGVLDENNNLQLNMAHICDPMQIKTPMELIKLSNYKISKSGELILFVSSSEDQKCCYRMKYNNALKHFVCDNCASKGENVTANCLKMNGKNVIKLEAKHICNPIEYNAHDENA